MSAQTEAELKNWREIDMDVSPDREIWTNPEHSDITSVRAAPRANVNVNKFSIPRDPWQLVTGTLLALSILVNVCLFMMWKHTEQTVDLDRYDDNTFINGRYSQLESQVKADHDLIQAYGLQKSLKEK